MLIDDVACIASPVDGLRRNDPFCSICASFITSGDVTTLASRNFPNGTRTIVWPSVHPISPPFHVSPLLRVMSGPKNSPVSISKLSLIVVVAPAKFTSAPSMRMLPTCRMPIGVGLLSVKLPLLKTILPAKKTVAI